MTEKQTLRPRQVIEIKGGNIIFAYNHKETAKREANRERVASELNKAYPTEYIRQEK
ncbi:MAG: hypothetical protein HYT07_04210 [Candidatus Levybacteria bacterium]|nr:hypothetical protein [Candidatus Levybacteria bacterium]